MEKIEKYREKYESEKTSGGEKEIESKEIESKETSSSEKESGAKSTVTPQLKKRVLVKEIPRHAGEKVCVKGFLHEIRAQSKVKFILLRELSGIIQAVALPELGELFKTIEKIPKESVLSITGIVKPQKQAPGGFEIQIESCTVLSEAHKELPIQVVEKGEEELSPQLQFEYRWIYLRKPKQALIFKIATTMESAMREYWLTHGYTQIHSPKIIGTPSEGGAEVFSFEYF